MTLDTRTLSDNSERTLFLDRSDSLSRFIIGTNCRYERTQNGWITEVKMIADKLERFDEATAAFKAWIALVEETS